MVLLPFRGTTSGVGVPEDQAWSLALRVWPPLLRGMEWQDYLLPPLPPPSPIRCPVLQWHVYRLTHSAGEGTRGKTTPQHFLPVPSLDSAYIKVQ